MGSSGERGATKEGLSMGKMGLEHDKVRLDASEDAGALESKASGEARWRGGVNGARPRIGQGQRKGGIWLGLMTENTESGDWAGGAMQSAKRKVRAGPSEKSRGGVGGRAGLMGGRNREGQGHQKTRARLDGRS